jgi:hypothetical protein
MMLLLGDGSVCLGVTCDAVFLKSRVQTVGGGIKIHGREWMAFLSDCFVGRVLAVCLVGSRARVLGVEVRQGEEILGFGTNHALQDTRAKLEDLPAGVPQEGIREPAADEHNREDWHSCQVHGHGSSRSNGVCSNVEVGETEHIFTDALGCCLELGTQEGAGDEFALVVCEDRADQAL